MAKKKNLSAYSKKGIKKTSNFNIGIVVSEWNENITESLYKGAVKALTDNGVKAKSITRINVPGSFELTYGSKLLCKNKKIHAVIAIGCVIKGETPHFDFICAAVANGITELNIQYNKPVIFGVLTTLNEQQAIERSGGKHGNKGIEAAITALKMLNI